MGSLSARRCWILAGLLLIGGCKGQDADILARVGRKLAMKGEAVTARAGTKLAGGWQAVRANLDELAVDARVAARLSWDQTLAGVPIEVHSQGTRVELRGTVADADQRRRAVELAEATLGVTEVTDSLQVAALGQ
jgi:osmotically-inducible protein OsmY